MKKILIAVIAAALLVLTGCSNDSDVVNKNLDKDADNFKVNRRVVFYNAILDKYIMVIEGFCSVDPGNTERMTVTCKVGNEYKRNALGKSDNVLWWYEQLGTSGVSPNHYKVILKPSVVIPEPEVR
jgi:uncharacterized lipoprotein NlpE involved in copper resistance